jgi:hypothetical protein
MKRTLIFTCVGVSIFAVALVILSSWSSRTSGAHAQAEHESVPVILPAGTSVRVRLVETISQDTKAGDTLQGTIADPVLVNSQIAIPANTRALVKLIRIQVRKDEIADVSLELKELISKDRSVPVHSSSVTTALKRMSDIDVLARSVAGMIGGAVGAARSASVGRSPDVGAARVGSQTAGATQQDTQEILVFKTAEPVDLSTVRW